ncbi:50S ribosomal protein L4 [Buchnera aphidicola (Nipponaphis monzeni)]|uniref:Large ribosomal subunit protein uL4 n=1 Tax=Buchnera aphidicola (Nipponaphis monzeni) TaxID=2495405 RepID=A0A455TAR5_9GAMM|nr:50S ribosomal protein L4 [Buchnera aphidicola]BBI01400.1 50S ribosomal protein L4 [Buchnera aphidicola (Nipponaphis monzeni)]
MQMVLKDDKTKLVTISDIIFNTSFNEGLIHQVITAYSNASRQGSKAQKNRSEVSGSGRKPWRQKGTGRARVGSIRSPIWRSGGVTFAAKPRNYCQKVNKKMYKGALKSIFSELIRTNRLVVFKDFYIDMPKTRMLIKKLNSIEFKEALILTSNLNKNLYLASRNLHKVCVQEIRYINPVSLITFKQIVCTVQSIKKIEEMLT